MLLQHNYAVAATESSLLCFLQQLVQCVIALHGRFRVAVKRAHNEAQSRETDAGLSAEEVAVAYEDDASVKGMVRLFLNATEAYASLVATGGEQVCIRALYTKALLSSASTPASTRLGIQMMLLKQYNVSGRCCAGCCIQRMVAVAATQLLTRCASQVLEPLLCVLDVCSHPDPELFKMAVWTVGKVAYSATLVHGTPRTTAAAAGVRAVCSGAEPQM